MMRYVDKVNLARFADSFPHTLSGGMKARVAIARGMVMQPDILLVEKLIFRNIERITVRHWGLQT